jgi:drug/metabolite transporter (DMT)-like permease
VLGVTAWPGGRGAGILAAFAAVLIWGSFLVITRFAVRGSFTVPELLLLRLVPAAALIAPVMWREGVLPRGLSWPRTVMLVIGAGIGFPAILMAGLQFAPASDAGALAPGMLPFWTALAAALMLGEVPGPRRKIGLGLILVGAGMVGLWQVLVHADSGAWRGHLCFLTAAALWAIYTVVYRQSGLTPIHALAIGLFWSTVIGLPILLWVGVPFEGAGPQAIVVMALLQGLLMGILSLLLYGYAVRQLGAAETGAFGALVPMLALVGGALFLGEEVNAVKVAGVALVAVGVFMASGILTRIAPRGVTASPVTDGPTPAGRPGSATTDRRQDAA